LSKRRKNKIMETPSEKTVDVNKGNEELSQNTIVPVEIMFHMAGVNVEKLDTPQGVITSLSLISPTGIAVTVRMNEQNLNQFIVDLTGGITIPQAPRIVVAR
jgi:hypothetical protein